MIPPDKTIAGIAVEYNGGATPEFTQLVAALSKVPALLAAADDETASLKVATTDAAFRNLYTQLGVANLDELVDEIGLAGLTKVLQHHVVGSVVFSSDLENGEVPTLSDEELTLDLSELTLTDGSNSNPPAGLVPTLRDVHATNGVIHVIDKVLIPTL